MHSPRASKALECRIVFPARLSDGPCRAGRRDDNEAVEFVDFTEAMAAVEHSHDFVVIDTPAV
jgi:hypothetical protein